MFKLNNNNNVIFLFVFLLSAVIILSKIFRSTDSNEDKEILKVFFFFNFFKFINARIYINIIFNKKGFQLQKGWLLTLIDLFLLKLINLML
jgi:hypothetical protein